MRITEGLFFLAVTCIHLSLEVPLLTTFNLETKVKEGITFTSPGYEHGRYPDRTQTFWELYAPEAWTIQIVFEDFDLEFHQNCIWDSVTLARSTCDQMKATGNGDVVLCGPLHAYVFESDHSHVCVRFISDLLVTRRGFKAHAFAKPGKGGNNKEFSIPKSSQTTAPSNTTSVSPHGETVGSLTNHSSLMTPTITEQSSSSSSTTTAAAAAATTTKSSSSSSSSSSSTTTTTTKPSSLLSSLSPSLSTASTNSAAVTSASQTISSLQSTPNKQTEHKLSTDLVQTQTSPVTADKPYVTSNSLPSVSQHLMSSTPGFGKRESTSSSLFVPSASKTAASVSMPVPSSSSSSTLSQITRPSLSSSSSSLPPPPQSSWQSLSLLETTSSLPTHETNSLVSSSPTAVESNLTSNASTEGGVTTPTITVSTFVIGEMTLTSIDMGNFDAVIIRSPSDDTGRYPLNTHYEFTVLNHQMADISVEFNTFDIEFHSHCSWDYLQLTLGNNLPQRFCGKTIPEPFITDAEILHLLFHSDHIVPSFGFEMKLAKLHLLTTRETHVSNNSRYPTSTRKATSGVSHGSTSITEHASSLSTKQTFSSSPLLPLSSSADNTVSKTSSPEPILFTSSSKGVTPPHSLTTIFSKLTSKLQSSKTSHSGAQTTLPKTDAAIKTTMIESLAKSTSGNTYSSFSPKVSSSLEPSTSSSIPLSLFAQHTSSKSPDAQTLTESFIDLQPSSSLPVETTKRTPVSASAATKATSNSKETSSPSLSESLTVSKSSSTKYSSTQTIPVLNVIICEFAESSIDISFVSEVIVQSPTDGSGNYPLNTEGMLTINNHLQLAVEIEFSHFDIEYHPNCILDYLKLKLDEEPPYRLCGNLLPRSRTTNASKIEMEFYSDNIATSSGFQMKLKKQTHYVPEGHNVSLSTTNRRTSTGGKQLTTIVTNYQTPSASSDEAGVTIETSSTKGHVAASTSHTFKSMEHSTSGSTSTESIAGDVQELITQEPKSTRVQQPLTTQYPHIPNTKGYVTESSAKGNEYFTTPENTIENNVNTPKSSSQGKQQTSSTYSMKTSTSQPASPAIIPSTISDLKSTSGKPLTQTSYSYTLSTILKASSTALSTRFTTTLSGTPTSFVPTKVTACVAELMPEVLNGDYGYIMSPEFGITEKYPADSVCQWKITGDQNKVIMVIFESFDVENSLGCKWDKLIFYETSNDGETNTKLVTLCGDTIPSTVSSNKTLLVEFKSDSVQQRAGFRFKYIKIKSEIGETYTCLPGKIPCASSGTCIPVEWWCDTIVDCDDHTDELYCHKCPDNQLQCGDGACLDMSNRCDGIPQCPYATDERDCVAVSNSNTPEQPVRVIVEGTWFPLCHDNLTTSIAGDLCKSANSRSVELLTKENADDVQLFSRAHVESGRLIFNTSVCPSKEVAHIQCSDTDCGRRDEKVRRKRIIGGSLSSKGEWPWTVALRVGNNVVCGGSIIDSLWVVTAGHCVKDLVENPQIVSIIAGANDINDIDRQIRYVSEVVIHPKYRYIFNADIALLRLQQPLGFDENTKPLCLPWDLRQFSPWDICYVTGFGVSNMNNYYTTVTPKYLRHIKTKIFDLEKCKDIYSTENRINDNMTCAGYTSGGMDACKGDSGSGLMCIGSDERWFLAGVVSWGDRCGMTNRPGVYTNVVPFMDWIGDITNPEEVRNVTCDFESTGWCGYTDISEGNYVWTRKPGDKYIKGTILYATKTLSDSHKASNATLMTPRFTSADDSCLAFSFLFSGNSNVTLSVYGAMEDTEGETQTSDLVWRVTSDYPAKDSWMTTEVTLPSRYNRLFFISKKENGGISGLGLDNVTLTIGQCVGSDFASCTFNKGNICNFTQGNGQNSKPWTIEQESTVEEGNRDSYAKAGGEFSSFGYHALSQLISPELSNEFTSLPHCVTFSYTKMTETENNLLLATYVKIGPYMTNQEVFWTSGDTKLEQWNTVSVTLPRGIYDFFVFEARRKEYTFETIEILLDDIKITNGICV